MKLTEIEIGPHFITLYSPQYREMLVASEKMYTWFLQSKPELAEIQQQNFIHEPNDPNVYHPFGEPNAFRKGFRHFHIRYGRSVEQSDVDFILNNLDKGSIIKDDLIISNLEDNKLPEFETKEYPVLQGNYLEYIEELRTGRWLK
jgi:hypothetical protein